MFHSQLTKSSSALVTSHKQESCLDSRHDVHPWSIRATVTMMIDIELNRFPVRIRSSAKYPFWSATLLFEPLRKQYKGCSLDKDWDSVPCTSRTFPGVSYLKENQDSLLVKRCLWPAAWFIFDLSIPFEPGRSKLTSPQLKEALTMSKKHSLQVDFSGIRTVLWTVQALRMETVVQSPAVSRRLSALNFAPNLKHVWFGG